MKGQAEVHGTVACGRTLVECSMCGPVAVTDATLFDAISAHLAEHDLERSST